MIENIKEHGRKGEKWKTVNKREVKKKKNSRVYFETIAKCEQEKMNTERQKIKWNKEQKGKKIKE